MFETLGQYRILDRIGAGRTGEVYRARDTRAGRTVAIRVVAPEIADELQSRESFLRDARATGALSHPNIAALYEIGEDQSHLFLVFEYVPGKTLATLVAGRALNPRHAIDLAIQLADALAVAHADAIIHRDIRPDNIVITPKGNAKFLDFGLSAWTAGGAGHENTPAIASRSGQSSGVATYMSPEQLAGEPLDERSDVFSLGVVLFEMLAGKPPFSGTTRDAVATQILQAEAPAPSAAAGKLPPELDAIVLKMLAKPLDRRYQAAATLAAELRSVAVSLDARSDEGVNVGLSKTGQSVRATATRPRRRIAALWIACALVAAIGLALFVAASSGGKQWLSSLPRTWPR